MWLNDSAKLLGKKYEEPMRFFGLKNMRGDKKIEQETVANKIRIS